MSIVAQKGITMALAQIQSIASRQSQSKKTKDLSNTLTAIHNLVKNYDGIVKLTTIVDKILGINNFKSETLNKLTSIEDPFKKVKFDEGIMVALDDLYIDFRYQRDLKLKPLLNRLKKAGEFRMFAAGTIDVAVRYDTGEAKYFVWDGYRRSILAGIVGITHLPASIRHHDKNSTEKECIDIESSDFKIRNASNDRMSGEEIWKAELSHNVQSALSLKNLLNNCGLNVQRVLSHSATLTGFDIFRKAHDKKTPLSFPDKAIEEAAHMIKDVFNLHRGNVSSWLILSLAYVIEMTEETDDQGNPVYESLSWYNDRCDLVEEIRSKLDHFVNIQAPKPKRTTYFTNDPYKNKEIETGVYRIVSQVLEVDDTDELKKLQESLSLPDDIVV